MKKMLSLLVAISVVSACSTISKLTVKEYTTSSGQKVTAGRYKPEAENQCQRRKKSSASWGFKGHLDPDGRYNEIVMQAVERAPSLKANYVYIHVPSSAGGGEGDINYSLAGVIYYHCQNPPE
ncbi:MAG: hypothetical protein P8Z75_08945 [Gammaproteobacteria bacterium]